MPRLVQRIFFRTHWLLGLVAGLVLAVVGGTGAILAFESELIDALNPALQVEAHGAPMDPAAIAAIAAAAHDGYRARSIEWRGDERAPIVRLARGSERGGLEVAVDPYRGVALGELRGTAFIATVEQLHRNLAAGPVGKQLVGASTIALIVLSISGIVLRWPRRHSLRTWLAFDGRLRGRALLRNLHLTAATWMLPLYLVVALSGLWWSYDVYRDAINRAAGVTQPQRRPDATNTRADLPPAEVDAAWTTFRREIADATRATIPLAGNADAQIEIRYQTRESPHMRAWNTLKIDAKSGAIASRELYAEQPAGRRFVSSLFPLHSGDFFGLPGRIAMAIAALLLPLFTLTGFWMWLQRRRAERVRTKRAPQPAAATPALDRA
ncbi:MAG TPA: PepSY-associated TM helix domain-containing protein [Rhodanobacteraceae bacterium]|nr:PepSY-associated TM helix domain-containing protein [Rhodanobacteraceae bacterium]